MGAEAVTTNLPQPGWDEPTFQRWVVPTARANGWRVRVMDTRAGGGLRRQGHKMDRGWPDLLLVRERVMWIELKAQGGKLRPDQEDVIELLRKAGAEVWIFTPRDWEELLGVL